MEDGGEAPKPTRAGALAALRQRSAARMKGGEGELREVGDQVKWGGDAAAHRAPPAPPKVLEKQVEALAWICGTCNRECLPIRSESRCMCGHRLREHEGNGQKCKNSRCQCKGFFYIVAEGSWILRCRCKHKHIEHDPNTHKCLKPNCKGCDRFDSPWVCNCDHPWSEHKQVAITRTVKTLEGMAAAAQDLVSVQPVEGGLEIAPDVNRWDQIQRGRPEEFQRKPAPKFEEIE